MPASLVVSLPSAVPCMQAVKAGYLPPRLYDRAVKREQRGWNVNLKLLEPLERALDWDGEEER